MSFKAQSLLTPHKVGNLTLKNRVVMAPMTRGRAPTWVPNDLMKEYYAARASAGLIITEGTHINEASRGWPHVPGIWTDEQTAAWKSITGAVHAKGGAIYCQLWHQGRQSNESYHNGKPCVSASDVKMENPYYNEDGTKPEVSKPPRPLTLEEIESTKADYVKAAKNAIAAGFDGVEIHSANGYLLDQFLQAHTNKRTDKYGGSVENRSRLTTEVIQVVGEAIGFDKTGVRFSPNGVFGEMGGWEGWRAQFEDIISKAGKMNLAYIHVMDGLGFGAHSLVEKDGQFTLKDVRKLVPKELTVMGNCGKSFEDGEKDISSGDADLIAFGRPFIGNPDLVEKITEGKAMDENPDAKYWYYPHLWAPAPDSKGYTDLSA